ncbi:TN [Mytilus coruscus]|uniref:TN n=1 Tax=Mytilus coruscus TaxID=42192 RepID=A0A6J8DK38_MYTCO|nr:TN [Mytilus coruscus]
MKLFDGHINPGKCEAACQTDLTFAPRQFDIAECTDCSITIEWFIDVQDECLSYELDDRPPGTENLPVRTFSSKDVMEGENGRRMYTLQNLLPETYYEFKLRSVYKDAKSHYSESKTKKTLILAPRKFDIAECTDCSITIEWFIDVQDECLSYELDHRPPQGTDNLPVRTFSSKDVVEGENGRRMYTLQNLLPETYYEFKLRSVYKDAKSHYSESKTKQTLILAPRQFDIAECTDCSITIEWFIDVQDECLSYELDDRPPGTENLPVRTFSSKDVMEGKMDDASPRKFDIVECTDCSITIEWFIDVQDECLWYELDRRPPQGTDNLSVRTFSSKDVVEGENGRRMYTLQNLLPEKCYELKLRSVYKDAKSHYSQSKTKQTLKIDGTDIHHIPLSYKPYHMTEINSNTVAVSCIFDRTILIINISTRSVTSTINTSGTCRGISYNDNNLYFVIDRSIIRVMDLTGEVIRTIPLPSDRSITNITVDRDRLVCRERTLIYCCSLDGKLMWEFKKDKFQDLRCVITDDEGNVYVTCSNTNTVVVISDDGKHHRELLTKSDGLNEPYGIYFDKKENILLVCNVSDRKAFLLT